MKAIRNLECRVSNIEKRLNDLSKEKKCKTSTVKMVLASILVLEKILKMIKHFFFEIDL